MTWRPFAEAVDFEVTLTQMRARSERRAWRIAMVSTVLLFGALIGLYSVLPLKTTTPFVVVANANTGQATVARLADGLPPRLAANESLDRAYLATFVLARESFDSSTLGDRDWSQVFSMSTVPVGQAYRAVHSADNPRRPFALYGTHTSLRPVLNSLQIESMTLRGLRKATIRFTRQLVDKSTGVAQHLDRRIAQIEYHYQPGLSLDDQNRLLNPLGFQVTAYRVDPDFSDSTEHP